MREMVCIVCPRGCTMKLEGSGESLTVTGNFCKRGAQFAVSEMTAPTRTICTTVRTVFPSVPVLPVRVSAEIPKDKIFEVMRAVNEAVVETPVRRGEAVIQNVLGLGVDIIATSDLLRHIEK